MTHPVIAGVDGSPQSLAAAHWAAREAARRGVPLRLLHAWSWLPHLLPGASSPTEFQGHTLRMLARTQADLAAAFPRLTVERELLNLSTPDGLLAAAQEADLLVLGSRGLGGFKDMLLGSTGLVAAARSTCPVVLVRADADSRDALPQRPVVLGLDARHPSDALIDFALHTAAQRGCPLHVVHAWDLPTPWSTHHLQLSEAERAEREDQETLLLHDALRGWSEKYPTVDIHPDVRSGSASQILVDESDPAALVVVGRRIRSHAVGPRLGLVAHAVIHYATSPVAVVPHQ
ncbi:universal stress protein [Streptacidiphilus sp. PAMC 29251]